MQCRRLFSQKIAQGGATCAVSQASELSSAWLAWLLTLGGSKWIFFFFEAHGWNPGVFAVLLSYFWAYLELCKVCNTPLKFALSWAHYSEQCACSTAAKVSKTCKMFSTSTCAAKTLCKKEQMHDMQKKTCGSTVFSTGHPRQYSLAPAMLVCADRTRRGMFIAVWPQILDALHCDTMYPLSKNYKSALSAGIQF